MTTSLPSGVDPIALEQQVCFALAVTNRAVLALYRPLLEPPGLTHPQYLVMLALWDHQKSAALDRPMTVKDIANALQMDSATISPMLKRLESLGLLTQSRSVVDERATEVELTRTVMQLLRLALKIPPAVVERLGVGRDELDLLRDVLIRVNTAAPAAGTLDN